MAKDKDLDEFGFEPMDDKQLADEFGFESVEAKDLDEFGFEEDDQEEPTPEEMSALEAGVTGFGQGASFGLTPIIAGAVGAGVETVEDIGDALGLTDDAKLREQGFTLEDDNPGLEGLLKSYYDARDAQKSQEEKAFEDQPAATIAGNVGGGIASMSGVSKAAASLGSGGRAAQALSKILPKADDLKKLSTVQKIGVGAREGAKAGALSGFGQGEGQLLKEDAQGNITADSILEGTVDVAKETAGTSVGGATVGGAIPTAGAALKKAGKFVKELPLIESLGLGFKAGKKGIDIGDENQVIDYITSIADDVKSKISTNFKGASKSQLLKEADELGIRVAAGEPVDDIINKIKTEGAFGPDEQRELTKFVQNLKSLSKDFDPNLEKAVKSIEKGAAKKAMNIQRKGGEITSRTDLDESLDELVPMPEAKGKVLGVEDRFELPSGKSGKNITTAAVLEDEVPLKQYDLENMKLSELDELIRKVGNEGYQKDTAASGYAKELYSRLREASNEAMTSSSIPERNKKLKSMFDALESLDIEPKDFFSNQDTIKDDVQKKIFQKITSGSLTGELDVRNFIKYMGRADERLAAELQDQTTFAKELGKFVRQSEGEGSVSLRAAAGPVQKILAKTGGLAGAGVKTAREAKSAIFKRMSDLTPTQIQEFSGQLGEIYGEKAAPFINTLTKAAEAKGTRKNALMYGIYQQPAFRKMLEDIGKKALNEDNDDVQTNTDSDMLGGSSGDLSKKKVYRQPQSVDQIDTALMHQLEGNKKQGYIPENDGKAIGQSGVTIAGGLDLGQRSNLDDIAISDELKVKLSPYLGLKKEAAQQKLSESPFEITDEEVVEINDAVKNAYFDKTQNEYNRLTGSDINELPAAVQTVMFSIMYNTGQIGPKTARLASEGKYEELVNEVRNWHGSRKVEKGLINRRNNEARYLEEQLKKLQEGKSNTGVENE